jgi:hypothetical protein
VVRMCLGSYSIQDLLDNDSWRLNPQDDPLTRQAEIRSLGALLAEFGEKLGFRVTGDQPILWISEEGKTAYAFSLLASASFGEILDADRYPQASRWIVIPGGRAALALFKMKRNPLMNQKMFKSWGVLKFRHLRRLFELSTINRENLPEQLLLDPLTDAAPQIRLL